MDVLTWGKTRTIETLKEGEGKLKQFVLQLDRVTTRDEITRDEITRDETTRDETTRDETEERLAYSLVNDKMNVKCVDMSIDLKKKDLSHFVYFTDL